MDEKMKWNIIKWNKAIVLLLGYLLYEFNWYTRQPIRN